jgi:hypothetical protein
MTDQGRSVNLGRADHLAGGDSAQQSFEADIACDWIGDGQGKEKNMVEDGHVCFRQYEYL